MSIEIELRDPTEEGRLFPNYDAEADVVELASSVERSWPFALNIDNSVIFDLDEDRRIANVDILVPRSEWKTDAREPNVTDRTTADIVVSDESVAHEFFDLMVVTATNADRSQLLVEFGPTEGAAAVTLSKHCIAFVKGDALTGWLVSELAPAATLGT